MNIIRLMMHEIKLAETKHASQSQLPYLQKTFDLIKGFKSNVSLDDIAKFCAKMEVEMGNAGDEQSIMYMLYNGIPPLKDNPSAMNDVILSFVEHYEDQDIDEAWEDVEHSAKRFFRNATTSY